MTSEMPNHSPYSDYRKWFTSSPENYTLETAIELSPDEPRFTVSSKVVNDSGLERISETLGGDMTYTYLTELPLSTETSRHRQDFLQALIENDNTYKQIKDVKESARSFKADYSSVNKGLTSFATLTRMLDSFDAITETYNSKELELMVEFSKKVRASDEFQKTKLFADYLTNTQLIPVIDTAENFVSEYLEQLRYDKRRDENTRYSLADNVSNRRMLTDAFQLLDDTFKDLCSRDMIHFEAKDIAEVDKKLKQHTEELSKEFPFDVGMSHRDFLDENAERLQQFLHYTKNVLNQRFVAKAPSGVSVGDLKGRLSSFIPLANFYRDAIAHGYPASKPTILPKEEKIFEIEGSVNPLLFATFDKNKKYSITPIDFSLNGNEPVALITGPNNGGKTTLGRHITIEQIMAQAGLYTLSKNTKVSMVDGLWFARSKGDNISDSHGIYKAYLEDAMSQLENATSYSFVFFDELGTGTDTQEGIRISEMVYDYLVSNGIRTLQSSHLTDLAKNTQEGKYQGVTLWGIKADDFGNPKYVPKKNIIGDSNGEFIARSVGFTAENLSRLSQNLETRYRNKDSKVD